MHMVLISLAGFKARIFTLSCQDNPVRYLRGCSSILVLSLGRRLPSRVAAISHRKIPYNLFLKSQHGELHKPAWQLAPWIKAMNQYETLSKQSDMGSSRRSIAGEARVKLQYARKLAQRGHSQMRQSACMAQK